MTLETVNEGQAEHWNSESGSVWVEHQETIDASIKEMGDELFERSGLEHGFHVLDIGCGCGTTTIEAGRRVGTDGRVRGLDISGPMLAHAEARAKTEGASNIHFKHGDAQIAKLPQAHFDAAISRFGVMFFADPEAAFKNIATGLKPGGHLSFVCWRSAAENPWMTVPAMAAAQHIEMKPGDPTAPGPFAFADADRVRSILSSAGYESIEVNPIDKEMNAGSGATLMASLDFFEKLGPLRTAMQGIDGELREKIRASILQAMKAFEVDGEVRMPQRAWHVSAKRPR